MASNTPGNPPSPARSIASSRDSVNFPRALGKRATHIPADDYAVALDAAGHSKQLDGGVSVYIPLPFCPSRCLSCDRNTQVTHEASDIDDYLAALDQEMTLVTARLGNRRPLLQLQLGGGTPNYLSEPQLIRLMSIVERHFLLTDATDTALDASPKRTSRSQLELLHGLGFRRINFEVRDIDPTVQKALGRSHSLPILHDVFDNARAVGFESLGMDLVYGLPMQTTASITATLQGIVGLDPDRVTCLAYARRPDVFQHQRSIDAATMPSLGDKMAMFNEVANVLQGAGYAWVGLDCFTHSDDPLALAQAQRELHRNWIGYTLQDHSTILGFGTSSISELPSMVVQNETQLSDWYDALWADRLPVSNGFHMSPADAEQRRALNDLMCNMELSQYSARLFEDDSGTIAQLEREGLIERRNDKISVSEHGRFALHQRWGDSSPTFRWASGF